MTIRRPSGADIPRLKELWLASYPGDGGYADMYFREYFSPETSIVAEDEHKIVSAGYWFPADYRAADRVLRFRYLFAAATDPAYRGRGFNTALTAAIIEMSRAEMIDGLVMESEPSTRGIIERMGGVPCAYVNEYTASFGERNARLNAFRAAENSMFRASHKDFNEFARLRAEYLAKAPNAFSWGERELRFMARDLEYDGGGAFLFRANGALRYICATLDENEIFVRETDCVRPEREYLLGALASVFPPRDTLRVRQRIGEPPLFDSNAERVYMSHVLPLSERANGVTREENYINLLAV